MYSTVSEIIRISQYAVHTYYCGRWCCNQIWNNEDEFKKVLVHLGDLHGFMEFFGMIGKLVSESGFEDTIYQADLCTTGSVKGMY